MQISSNINFRGKLFIEGKPSEAIRQAIENSPPVQAYISGKKNMLVHVSRHTAHRKDAQNEDLFKLYFKRSTSRKNWLLRLWDWTNPPAKLSKKYYPEKKILDWLGNKPFMQGKVFNKVDESYY